MYIFRYVYVCLGGEWNVERKESLGEVKSNKFGKLVTTKDDLNSVVLQWKDY